MQKSEVNKQTFRSWIGPPEYTKFTSYFFMNGNDPEFDRSFPIKTPFDDLLFT